MRERFIELLKEGKENFSKKVHEEIKKILAEKHKYNSKNDGKYNMWEEIADHLIANGAIVPPCRSGEKVYKVYKGNFKSIEELTAEPCGIVTKNFLGYYNVIPLDEIGKTVFFSKEEAKAAMAAEERKRQND